MTLLTAKVDQLFSEWSKPDSPGCAIAIIQHGQVIYSRGYGMADLEHNIPIAIDSVFDIGSTSKQFTAMCIAILARQGRLSLEDEIQKHLPEIRQYEQPVTICHLIHHTSGLRDYLALMYLNGLRFENEYPSEEIIGLIARQQGLNFNPGEEFLYSNSGYLLLAEIVKRVSGKSLREFAHEHIFSPLGMKNTHFHDDFSEIVKNRAVGYSPKEGGGYRIDTSIFDVVGDGAIYTTVEDLSLWDANFYQNIIGGYGQGLIEEMTTPGKLNSGEPLDYGFALFVRSYRGLKEITHGGAWMGYRAELIRFPEQQFSVICLSNLSTVNPSRLAGQVADIYLAEEFSEPEQQIRPVEQQFIEITGPEIEKKAGIYRSQRDGFFCELTIQDGTLWADAFGMSFQLAPVNSCCYYAVGIPYDIKIEFEDSDARDPTLMYFQAEGGKTKTLKRVHRATVDPGQLSEYAGNYYSAELEIYYRLSIENSEISLLRKNLPPEKLKPVTVDLLLGKDLLIEFIRDEQKQLTGFKLAMQRITNILFCKQ